MKWYAKTLYIKNLQGKMEIYAKPHVKLIIVHITRPSFAILSDLIKNRMALKSIASALILKNAWIEAKIQIQYASLQLALNYLKTMEAFVRPHV